MKTSNQKGLPTLQIIKIKKILFIALVSLVLTTLASCTAEEVPTTKPIKNQLSTAKEGDIDPPTNPTTPPGKP
jgi:hypothetical protein